MSIWGKDDPDHLDARDELAGCPGCGEMDYAPFATLRTVGRRGTDLYVSAITGHYMACARCGEVFCTSLHAKGLTFKPHSKALAALGYVEPVPPPEYQHSTQRQEQAPRVPPSRLTPRERKAGV